jgi:hypothetical protein
MTTTSTTTTPTTSTPNHFSSVTTLGKPLSYHEQRVQSSQGRLKVANATLVFGAALLVFGGFLMLQENGNALCLVLPGVGLLGLGLLGWWDAKSTPDLRMAIFEEGVAVSEKQALKMMRWEEVDRAFQILTRRGNTDIIQHGYRLENGKGHTIWWNDDVSHAAQAWEAVRREVYSRLLQRMTPEFNRGDTVSFGEFSVNHEGVTQGKKSLAWSTLREVQITNGLLTVKGETNGKKEELRAMWATIPNAELLLKFIEQMRPKG